MPIHIFFEYQEKILQFALQDSYLELSFNLTLANGYSFAVDAVIKLVDSGPSAS